MTFTVEEKVGQQLATVAAASGRQPDVYLSEIIRRELNPDDKLPSGSAPLPDTRLSDYLKSQWPGDETDEEMLALADWVDD